MQSTSSRIAILAVVAATGALFGACSGSSSSTDSNQPPIVPGDADAGDLPPPGPDAGGDAGLPPAPDSGAIQFGTPGPWPTAPVTVFGAAQGLLESTIEDVSTDEAQNIWAVSHDALYLLKPGETKFRRYAAADGLSLDNAMPPGITAVSGGAPGEAFVGYQGAYIEDTQKDPLRYKGKLDRVLLRDDGTLSVSFYNVHNNDAVGFNPDGSVITAPNGCPAPQYTDWSFNEDRTVERFLYDHLYHRGTLYVGYNHGVARFEAGKPDPTTCFDYADHIHPTVYNPQGTQRMGEWRALALDKIERRDRNGAPQTGMLWMGGRWAAGGSAWTSTLFDWARNQTNPFWIAFANPPVFAVTPGDSIYLMGIAPLSDGTVYFASGAGTWGFAPLGIAQWKGQKNFTYISPGAIGLPSASIVDFQALPDDTILIALDGQGLWRWDPKPEPNGRMLGKISGLPSDTITKVYVDQMVKPTAVYVGTARGFALLRLP